jgi:ribosome production factor 2
MKIDSKKYAGASKLEATRKAKTHKGRKILEAKMPKLVENPKSSVFLKGNKTSEVVNKVLKELHCLRDNMSTFLQKKRNNIYPFEEAAKLEDLAKKQDTSLFVFGNHSKKRPQNIVMGRLFNWKILDMYELAITKFKSIDDFKVNDMDKNIKPLLVFQGDLFETSTQHMKIKTFFIGKVCIITLKISLSKEIWTMLASVR